MCNDICTFVLRQTSEVQVKMKLSGNSAINKTILVDIRVAVTHVCPLCEKATQPSGQNTEMSIRVIEKFIFITFAVVAIGTRITLIKHVSAHPLDTFASRELNWSST